MYIELYTKDSCSYCTKAKIMLTAHQMGFTERKLDKDFSLEYLREMFPMATTFPVVVVDGFYIGGYEQLTEKLKEDGSESRTLLNEGKL
jgi:glutaredoxin